MKTCYVEMAYRAIADLVAPGELMPGWTITRINVPKQHRGIGIGSKLLTQICADADWEGVDLYLEPQPSDGLTRSQLIRWYGRYDFRMTQHGYMKRLPRVTA
jgi:ribosomal protein S18 acetylase RimI-like enzyme